MKKLFLILGALAALAAPLPAAAASPLTHVAVCSADSIANIFGFQPWYACLPQASDGSPKIESLSDIFKIIFPLVDSLVKIAVYVAAGFIFFMLFKIAMARGDSGKIATAISGIRDAVIGLIIAMVSVGIVNFIAGAFIK